MSELRKQQIQRPAAGEHLRFCPKCDRMIPISEFGINRQRKDKLNRYCRPHIRQTVNARRAANKGYRKNKRQRKLARQKALALAAQKQLAPSTVEQVLEYLEHKGQATQKEIQKATGLPRALVDVALTELFIVRRKIGTRPLTLDDRIYFCL